MCKGTLMNLEIFLIQLLTVCLAEILQNLYYLYNLKKTSFRIRSLTFSVFKEMVEVPETRLPYSFSCVVLVTLYLELWFHTNRCA